VATRMLCTACCETAQPDTVIGGSDLVEILGWMLLAIPGWLYCSWRHALRTKICTHCGSDALIREARAASARRVPVETRPTQTIKSSGATQLWPRALAIPRDRMRRGGVGATLVLAWVVASAWTAMGAALFFGIFCATWLIVESNRVFRLRAPQCTAWDASGRALELRWID
jgi:hypothetical protein